MSTSPTRLYVRMPASEQGEQLEQENPRKRRKTVCDIDELTVRVDNSEPSGQGKKFNSSTSDISSVAFSLRIPNQLLFHWNTNKTETKSYIDLVNNKITGGAVRLKAGCERLEKRLSEQASRITRKVTRTGGRKRKNLLDLEYNVFVLQNEAESFTHVRAEVDEKMSAKDQELSKLAKELARLKSNASDKDNMFRNKGKKIEEVSTRQAR